MWSNGYGGRLATPPYVADANTQQRRFNLVVSEGSQGSVRGPITLPRLPEKKAEVTVSSMKCKPQKVKRLSQLSVVTLAQVVLVGSAGELARLTEGLQRRFYLRCSP